MRHSMRYALFGGTFDPIHNGHLAIARYVIRTLGYARVYIMPAYSVPLRSAHPMASPSDRLSMCMRAARSVARASVLAHEIAAEAPSYLSATISYVRTAWQVTEKIPVIIGDDLLPELHLWRDIELLRAWIHLIIFRRMSPDDRNKNDALLANSGLSATYAENAVVDISSSAIRRMLMRHERVADMLPHSVYRYIRAHNLYCQRAS